MRDLTDAEQHVLDLLADAWAGALALPPVHPADNPELVHHIHAAQNIILARPAVEQQNDDRRKGVVKDEQRHRRTKISDACGCHACTSFRTAR